MKLSDNIFSPEKYTYNDYKLWKGDWELINGYPVAMSPSPKRTHQWFATNFIFLTIDFLKQNKANCNCEVYSELDWIVNDDTVLRPDCMIVCGDFKEDYLTFPPALVLEISSHSTRLRDRNTKFNLYEMYGVKYYIIADCDKTTVEVFELTNNKYQQTLAAVFQLTEKCIINIDVLNLWSGLM